MTEPTNSSRKSSMQTQASTALMMPHLYSQPLSVFVGGIPKTASEDELSQFMSQFGYVKDVYISKDEASDIHKGYGFVNFADVEDAHNLFGEHSWHCKRIEIKRSLQKYITLKGLPLKATEQHVAQAFQRLGYITTEVLIGGRTVGVPLGTAGVELNKFYLQVQVAKLGTINILGKKVKMMQFIRMPSRGMSGNFDKSEDLPIKANPWASMHLTPEPRSPTESAPKFPSAGCSPASASSSRLSATSFEVLDQHPVYSQLSPGLTSRVDEMPNLQTTSASIHQIKTASVDIPLSKLRIPREPQPTSVCTCDRYKICHQCYGVWPGIREINISFYAFPGHL